MGRIEENSEVINLIFEIGTKAIKDGIDSRATVTGNVLVILADISKSLAIIADNTEALRYMNTDYGKADSND